MSDENRVDMSSEGRRALIAKFVDAFSGFIGLVIFANVLGVAGLGIYYIARAIASVTARPISGIGVAVEQRASADRSRLNTLITTGFLLSLLYGIIGSIIGILLYLFVPPIQDLGVSSDLILLTIFLFFTLSQFTVLNRAYSGAGEPGRSVSVDTGRGILETMLQLLFLGLGWGVEGLVLGTALATIVASIYLVICTPFCFVSPCKRALASILSFARWCSITRTIEKLYNRLDTLLLAVLLGEEAVGIYEAAMRLVQPAKYIGYAIKRPLLVRASEDLANKREILPALTQSGPYASFLAIPLFAGGIFIAPELLGTLYGDDFVAGAPIVIGGAVYYILFCQSNLLAAFLHGIDKPQSVTRSIFAGTLVRVGGILMFVPLLGLPGIIGAIIIADLVRGTLLWIAVKSVTGHAYAPTRIKYQLFSALGMAALVFIITTILPPTSVIGLLTSLICGGILYFGIFILLDDTARIKAESLYNALVNYR